MMRIYAAMLLLVVAATLCGGQRDPNRGLVPFTLKSKNQVLANIRVPKGYEEQTRSYGEGIQKTLVYPDGAYIILHVGAMMRLPLFSDSTHQERTSQILDNWIVKSGQVQGTELFWREKNSKGTWPAMNIGYSNVPKERLNLFEKSLSSFKRITP